MDARIDGVPVTPRSGKPVEVNALWLRALDVAAAFARRRRVSRPVHRAARVGGRFVRRAVRSSRRRGLLDVVDGPNGDDASVRPNQLLAVSLPGGPLDAGAMRAVVDVCRRSLLTPLGLRSLAPDDPRYRPYHRGGPAERDGAYHQGTVWPWLIGPYVDAARRGGGPLDGAPRRSRGAPRRLRAWARSPRPPTALRRTLATGCPFQAWSVAELLRVLSSRE